MKECPQCDAPLLDHREGLYGDIPVLACRACRAAFYPPGSLDRLDDSLFVDAEALPLEPRDGPVLRCPVCAVAGYRETRGVELAPRRYAHDHGIEIAICPACAGFWVEDAMLERVRDLALRLSSEENRALNEEARKRQERERRAKKKRGK